MRKITGNLASNGFKALMVLSIVIVLSALILAQFGAISSYASEYRQVTTVTVGELS